MSNNSTLGDYVLEELVGKGPLGSCYRATHLFTKKTYAIKILPSEWSDDPHFVERFEGQVQKLAQQDHPHSVKLHSVSFHEGSYFIVSDWIENAQPLFKWLKEHTASPRILMGLVQVAAALDALHEKGLVHGAIHPHNILVQEGAEGIKFHLSDAALVQILGVEHLLKKIWQAVVTHHEHCDERLLDYFAFLAPEQKHGHGPTPATDSWAFGVLLYYAIFQRYPEGLFALPADPILESIIRSTLQYEPSQRALQLQPLFESRAASSVMTAGVEKIIQERMRSDHTVTHYQVADRDREELQPLLSEMVTIPSGTYRRGTQIGGRDEAPEHDVRLSSFAIDIHPVTNEQFVRFLEYMGSEKDRAHHDMIRLKESRIRRIAGKLVIESGYSKHPVIGVTWYGARAYAEWLGKRLPTEAEWEAAAKSQEQEAPYPTGNEIEKHQANFFGTDTTPVMSYPPNGWGIFDMAGNVYEWCEDWYDFNFYTLSAQEPDNPKGPAQGVYRVLRGGCWKSLKDDLRTTHRHRNNPGVFNKTYGFRCARSL